MAGNEIEKANKAEAGLAPHAAEKPKIEALGVALGVDQNLPFSTPYSTEKYKGKTTEEQLYELMREQGEDSGPTVGQLVAMRRMDGQARALYRLLTLPIRAALSTSTFVPAEGGEAEADFIDQVFNLPPEQGGMSVTFHRFLSQVLSGLFDGFSAFEQVYWQPTFGPLKGKYSLKKLAYRPPETITFVTDKTGGFAGLRQRAHVNGESVDVFIPAEQAFYYAAQEEERKFYGISFFQSAFYHYDKKMKSYFLAHLASQRAAVGTRVGEVPVNASEKAKQEFKAGLQNLSFAQWMMYPEGFKVEILKEGGNFDFLDYINHHNSQMSKSILAGFFDKDQGAGQNDGGSLVNFAQPGDEMFVLMLRAIMDDIANSINHYIIPRLIDWNFPGGKYPTFTWAALTDEQKGAIAGTFDKLASAGQSINVTPEFMRELEKHMAEEMGFEIDYDEIAEREEEEALAQEEMLQQQMDAQNAAAVPGEEPNPQLDKFEEQVAALSGGSPELINLAHGLLKDAEKLELASRKVQTVEGSKKYGAPIGSTITDDVEGGDEERPVTIERLNSLKRQLIAARKFSNDALVKSLTEQLSWAVRQFAVGKTPEEIKSVLRQMSPNVDPDAKK